jgi:hypothetical protein
MEVPPFEAVQKAYFSDGGVEKATVGFLNRLLILADVVDCQGRARLGHAAETDDSLTGQL